ncbi:unnamed protein product [Acanthoscelides obtectus]|uniref:Homeobox domain-containing protein n=1 Tax=Acanthoscelides obtectus TaxID=200917 RepID=A0A9P0KSL8_ACAOB|nr:unnamed protein product [Acanthoscelides obtectus]CAK1659118.1 Homeobox protein PKNOX1 [Acanthoscelides obtectus]
MTKVCRLCLSKLQRGSKYFNINAVESFTGFMPYRDQLTTCIPEMALDLIPNPVICNTCRTALKTSYEFKSRCLLVEKKIREYVESQGCEDENATCDLAKIPIADLPPLHKLNFLQKELECLEEQQIQEQMKQQQFLMQQHQQLQKQKQQQQQPQASKNNSQLLLQLQKEVILPNSSEIEISMGLNNKGGRRKAPEVKNSSKSENDELSECTRCDQVFLNAELLELHKETHKHDEFACNFCKEAFKTLQQLRRHNNICSKVMGSGEVNPILTKRPHLPTKAKNHLKRWLFKHTDHPYPTDHQKQTLMQETNLSLLQVENWFINARRRILQDLTKLKSHGVREEELHEHNLGFQSDLDLELLMSAGETSPVNKRPQNNPPPPLVPIKRARRGRYFRRRWAPIKPHPALEYELEGGANINGTAEAERGEKPGADVKVEPDVRQDPLEIVSALSVKSEPKDNEEEEEEEQEDEEDEVDEEVTVKHERLANEEEMDDDSKDNQENGSTDDDGTDGER